MKPLTLTPEVLRVAEYLQQAASAVQHQAMMQAYWGHAKVTKLERREATVAVGPVRSTRAVRVKLVDGVVQVICSCPICLEDPDRVCVHKASAMICLDQHLRDNMIFAWDTVLRSLVDEKPRRSSAARGRSLLVFSLQAGYGDWRLVPYSVSASLVPPETWNDSEALYRHLRKARALDSARGIRTGKRQFVNATPEAERAVPVLGSLSQTYSYDDAQYALVFGAMLPEIAGCPVFLGRSGAPLETPLKVVTQPVTPSLHLTRGEGGLDIRLEMMVDGMPLDLFGMRAEVVCMEPIVIMADNTLIPVDPEARSILSLFQDPWVSVPKEEEPAFLEHYLAPVAERVLLTGDEVTWDDVEADPEKRLYLSDHREGGLAATLRFGYGPYEVDYDKDHPETAIITRPGQLALARIHRRPEEEEAAHKALSGFGLKRGAEPGEYVLRARVSPVDFLLRDALRIAQAGYTVYGEEALTAARVNRNKPTLSFNVSSGIDWFDVAAVLNYGDLQVDLKTVRRAIRRRERYIKLADGSIGVLPDDWLERYQRLLGLGEETDDGLRFTSQQALLLDQLISDSDGSSTDEAFRQRRDRLRDFQSITQHEPPRGFRGELRPYQKAGYDWLHFLREYGFGGILADDMGLGKTAEALAFLLSLRESGAATGPDLIVMPRSLLFNWQREAARFTPGLKVLIHADKGRAQDLEAFDDYDLVLTTYGVMLKEVEALRGRRFHYVVLDESQAIKNPLSQTARAARLLKADHRLVLTGTPVENTTVELWSQFAFLNPGLLGGLDHFRTSFVAPIERRQSTEAADTLRRLVHPFILRRTKAQVAPELPPRTERVMVIDMEPAQRRMYDKWRDVYRAQVLGLIEGEDMADARMKILEGLLRLRQISNDPRTVDAKYKGGSGKFDALLETLETLRDEGHKALVFSQFVQMLALVREALDARGVPYAYLDGSTRDRQTQVDAFQSNPDLPFFLVSLKAGGVGLNLTAADYVIHIDPWWNPAVEMQATDRTHRIGQDKPVFIYKLITRDSVEEKILDLQARKRALVDQLVSAESGFLKSLTRDDVEALFT